MGMKSKTASLDENEKVVDANRRRFDDQIGFSAILEAVNNAIIVIDHQGTITFANQHTLTLFSYDRDELLGKTIEVLLPERFQHHHLNQRNNYYAKPSRRGMGIGMDLFARRYDGSEFPCEVSLSPLETETGDYVICGVYDISLRKQTEEALRESEERLHGALDASQAGTWRVDFRTGLDTRDASLNLLLGLAAKASIQTIDEWFSYVHPDDVKAMKQAWDQALQSGNYDIEHRLVREDGRVLWVYDRGKIMRDKNGELTYAIGTVIDITSRKQAEEAVMESERKLHEQLESRVQERTQELIEANQKLKQEVYDRETAEKLAKNSEARFKMIYEYSPVMIDAFDNQGRCLMWNKECEKVFGWTAEEVFSHDNPLELFYPDPQVQKQVVDSVTSSPDDEFKEWRTKRKDGSELICLWANFTLPDGQIINLGHDITQTKRTEEELRIAGEEASQHRERLAHLVRIQTLGEMASGIAHEINQPLAAIESYAQASQRYLQTKPLNTEKLIELVEKISVQARRAGSVVSHLRSMMQRRTVTPISLDINTLLQEISKIAEIDTKQHNYRLVFNLTPSLPNVIGDEIQIQQVVINLIRNASDAMNEMNYKMEHEIVVATKKKGEKEVEVLISDHGPGIASRNENIVFEAFHTTKKTGLGMGLPICKSIIEDHGGEIGYLQNEPRGVTFYFTLPVDNEGI
jgi:two-component system, LuxR family, sensor kinase FixL